MKLHRVDEPQSNVPEENFSHILVTSLERYIGAARTDAYGSEEEVADYIVFLSSPSTSYINGTGLTIDPDISMDIVYQETSD